MQQKHHGRDALALMVGTQGQHRVCRRLARLDVALDKTRRQPLHAALLAHGVLLIEQPAKLRGVGTQALHRESGRLGRYQAVAPFALETGPQLLTRLAEVQGDRGIPCHDTSPGRKARRPVQGLLRGEQRQTRTHPGQPCTQLAIDLGLVSGCERLGPDWPARAQRQRHHPGQSSTNELRERDSSSFGFNTPPHTRDPDGLHATAVGPILLQGRRGGHMVAIPVSRVKVIPEQLHRPRMPVL